MAAFRQLRFQKLAEWCQSDTNVRALTMTIDSDDTTNDVWKICEQMWLDNRIPPGSMKHYGGAGRVVWIDSGRVVDYDWCSELMDLDALKARTKHAFR